MDEKEKISAEVKLQLLEAKAEIEKNLQSRFHWKRGFCTALLTGVSFFAFGLICQAPKGKSLAFGLIGAVTGLMVGACRQTTQKKQ